MSTHTPEEVQAELVARLSDLKEDSARRDFLGQNPQLRDKALVLQLTEDVVKVAREDMERAERLAEAATWLAELLDDDFCRARSARANGHLLALRGKHTEALEGYQQAMDLFHRLGEETEEGVTLSSSLQPLIYLSRYEEAFARAEKARAVFKRQGDRLRLARLDANLANILHRQDRFQEALVLYERACDVLKELGMHRDAAIVLANMAVSWISLYDFPRALDAYQQARAYCEQHHMPMLAALADYNIAYLYYLRGEYPRAIELYQATRVFCDRVGDAYHRALCDLDQSEMYLELNLTEEATQLAQRAFASFEETGMGYEAAKALAFLGIGAVQERKPFRALEFFAKARERFAQEKNWSWPVVLDLYQALVFYHEGRFYEARRKCDAALSVLSHSSLVGKACFAELLRAALHLAAAELPMARHWCNAALKRIERVPSPALRYQACFALGQIQEAENDAPAAHQSYREALAALESLPSHRHAEELKIPFIKNKFAVYEALVTTGMQSSALSEGAVNQEAAFAIIEKAKSRQLADLIAFRAHALPAPSGIRSGLVQQVKSLREELNWYYRQLDLEELRQEQGSGEHMEGLRQRTREHEAQLFKTLGELSSTDEEFLSLQNASSTPLETIRRVLPEDTLLVEYYQAREIIYACVVDQSQVKLLPLTPASRVQNSLRLLRDEFHKFQLGSDYVRSFAEPMLKAALAHLQDLHGELIAPLRNHLTAAHLIVVPHGFLHALPFHALFDGKRFLADEYAISYSGSASLYYLCCSKKTQVEDRSLILGPSVEMEQLATEEAKSVAEVLPNPRLLLGEEASEQTWRTLGPGSRYLHFFTQGTFREDNPLFSSIRLGKSQVTLADLYHLRLPCELVTISSHGPGPNLAENVEVLLGLLRGLLYAGAESVLLNLWHGEEPSTASLLVSFYRHLRDNSNKALALQRAMQEVRKTHPHPYYWAPFALRGKPGPT